MLTDQRCLLFFVRVHLEFMVLVLFASNFTAATAATTHKIYTLKIFYYLQSDWAGLKKPKSNWAGLKTFRDRGMLFKYI